MILKKVNLTDLTEWIEQRKPEVEQTMIRNQPVGKRIRTRVRDEDEQRILDILCIRKWEKAEQEGKIKYLSNRKWYYDYS